MGYRKAEEILPAELIEQIQQYVDGQNIYIPKRADNRLEWGARTKIRQELEVRNHQIYADYQDGMRIAELTDKYCLSEKSIQRIIRDMKA